ncbi:peptidyl-glycine alpha-amidating monooxygenase A-like isoform X3 [Dysidea avara]|uniref:peptidyl-glycine alpha-amidating monooxygenase A-like isoform X3 n=1 Tax=Dysidea avara TaxID=196820 RepID=UPI003318284A
MKLLALLSLLFAVWATGSTNTKPLSLTIPWSSNTKANDYRCVAAQVPAEAKYLVRFEPRVNTTSVHHMLLFGCHVPFATNQTWDCKAMSKLCSGSFAAHILFGWGRNASGIQLPEGVGFKVGASTDISWFVLQLHYSSQPPSTQPSPGLIVQLTDGEKQSVAGVYVLAAYGYKPIPPTTDVVNFDLACHHHGNPIVPIAFRVHAHSLGIKITGYVVKNSGKEWVELGSKSPQDPQAFYPIVSNVTVTEGDYLAARCVYSSIGVTQTVHIGADTSDEMCNFYIMYSTANTPSAVTYGSCSQPAEQSLVFPEEEDEEDYECPEIVPPVDWQKKEANLRVDDQWALNGVSGNGAMSVLGLSLGQVTAVQAHNGHVYILHRGVVVWDYKSFDPTDHYTGIADGPIQQPTVLQLNSTGHLVTKWGENKFYMPHGLTIDTAGNYWITDVAMHQVFKFSPQHEQLLELGVKFTPGNDHNHFCKPASVAVDAVTGVVFVADGYCNSRVVVFSPTGQYVKEQSAAVNNIVLNVVHKLVIVEKLDQLLVADRENGRIIAYRLQDLRLLWSMVLPELGGKVYSIDVDSSAGVRLFAVSTGSEVGVTYDQSGIVLDKWGPLNAKFLNPHDVAMDTDFSAVYVVEIGPNRIWKFTREPKNDNTTSVLKVVAVVLTLLVLLVGLVVICLTMMYCNNGQWSRRRRMDLRKKASQLFNNGGHRGFAKVRTFDPDASDEGDEMTIFSKM